jgi:hypothetical protein
MVKRHEGVYDGRFKLIHFYNDIDEWEFYDLQTDPHELRNVIDDSTYSTEVARLKTELERQKTKLNVPPVEVNTKSAIFDAPFPEGRPGMKKMIERLRNDIEQRRKK